MTTPTPAQLHHLANRARDGVALPAEHDQLAAGITAMADERDAAQQRLDFHDRCTLPDLHRRTASDAATIQRWRTRAEQAEAVNARVRQMTDYWEQHLPEVVRLPAVVAALRAALDQAQQPTT